MDNEAKKNVTREEICIEDIKGMIEKKLVWARNTQVTLETNLKNMDVETSGFLNGVIYACEALGDCIDLIEHSYSKEE
jgi:hypothetical protein